MAHVSPISLDAGNYFQYGDELDLPDVPDNCLLGIDLGMDLGSFDNNLDASNLDFSAVGQPRNSLVQPASFATPELKQWPSHSNKSTVGSSSQTPAYRPLLLLVHLEALEARPAFDNRKQKGKRMARIEEELQKTKRLGNRKNNPCIQCKMYHKSVGPDLLL